MLRPCDCGRCALVRGRTCLDAGDHPGAATTGPLSGGQPQRVAVLEGLLHGEQCLMGRGRTG